MLAAATFPAAIARITVAGPVTQSPPANTPSFSAIELSFCAKKRPRFAGMPARSNGSETISCPIATITISQGICIGSLPEFAGEGRLPVIRPIILGSANCRYYGRWRGSI